MEAWILMQQAELLRISIEVESMKAENAIRESSGAAPAFNRDHFLYSAREAQSVYNDLQNYRNLG